MDTSMIEATQALEFDDFEEENDQRDDKTVAYLNVPCQKGFPGKLFPIIEGDNLVGRGEHCAIYIPLKGLSREHACIEVKGEHHFIYDKGSRNKTRRNKFFLATSVRYELKDRDELIFGDVNCTYQVGTQVNDDGDETGSDTGSESMFETAPVASCFTVMETPAPPPKARKGFADDLVLPESDSEGDSDIPKTILAKDCKDADRSADHLMGAPTQAFVCESDVTTDDDESPKKKSILTAATQAYDMDITGEEEEEDEDAQCRPSLLTAATQAFVADSKDSPHKKTLGKQTKMEPTLKYDMAEGIEPTQGYDMDGEDEEAEDQDEESDKKHLLCQPTQAFVGDTEEDESIIEEDETDKSKLMAEPTQAFLGSKDKDEADGDSDSESSEEFVLEGDTDNEEGLDEAKDMFAAPTLACETDVVELEGEENNDQACKINDNKQEDKTEDISEDRTQAIDDGKTVAVSECETLAIVEDKTQAISDDNTQAIVEDKTQAIGEERTLAISETETQAITDDKTQAIAEDKTQAIGEERTRAISEAETQAISDNADSGIYSASKVTDKSDEITTQILEGEITKELTDIHAKDNKKSNPVEECDTQDFVSTEDTDTFDINAASTLVTSDSIEYSGNLDNVKGTDDGLCQDQSVTQSWNRNFGEGKNPKALSELETQVFDDATVKVTDIDKTMPVVDETAPVDETVPVTDMVTDKEPAIADHMTNDIGDTVQVSETIQVSETMPVSDTVQVTETVSVTDIVAMETVPISETVPVSEKIPVSETLPVSDIADMEAVPKDTVKSGVGENKEPNKSERRVQETIPVTCETDEAVVIDEPKSEVINVEKDSGTENEAVRTDLDGNRNSINVTEKLDIKSDMKKTRGGRSTRKQTEKDKEINNDQTDNNESGDTDGTESLTRGRGRRGKADVKNVDSEKSKDVNSKRRSNKTQDAGTGSVTLDSKVQNTQNGQKPDIVEGKTASRKVNSECSKVIDAENKKSESSTGNRRSARGKSKVGNEAECKTVPENTGKGVPDLEEPQDVSEDNDNQSRSGTGRSKRGPEPDNVKNQEPATQAYIENHLEPATQAYMDQSPKKGKCNEAATQIYQDEDSTPSLSEMDVDEDEKTNPLIISKPALVPLPSKSPLKSAIASPGRKKSPSPKRVQFVSQSSDTGSESSQTNSRSRRSKRSLDLKPKESTTEPEKRKGNTKAKGGVKGKQKDMLQDTETTLVDSKEDDGTRDHIQGDKKNSTNMDGNKQIENRAIAVDLSEGDTGRSRRVSNRPKTCAKMETEENETELGKVNVSETRTRSKRGKSKNEVEKVDTEKSMKSEMDDKSDSLVNNEIKGRRGRKKEQTDLSVSDTNAKGKDSKIDKTSEAGLKRPTRGKLKEAEDSTIENEKVQNKRKSRSQGNSSDIVQSIDTDITSEITESESKVKQNFKKSEPLEKVVEVSDETIVSKQPTRSKRTGQMTAKELKTEVDKEKVNEPVKGKSASVKQEVDKIANQEEVRPSRSRRTKVNVSDDNRIEETVANLETDVDKNSVKNEPYRGRKRKVNEVENESKVNIDQQSTASNNDLNYKVKADAIESERPKRASTKQKLEESQTEDKKMKGKTIEKIDSEASSKDIKARRLGKRKGTDDSSTDSNDGMEETTPAKKQKLKDSQSTPQSTAKVVGGTPKNSLKKSSSHETPKGKQLDTSVAGSPTLRKTTTNGLKPKVMFTGVTDEQGEKIVKDLGGEMVSSVMECTHLVTDQIRRTVKFLCCLARGIPIVSPQWLISSKKCGFCSDTTPHLIRDDTSEKKFKCNLQRSMNKAAEGPLLVGYKIHVTKSVKPGPEQMKDILTCAGAQFVGTMPRASSPTTVVISCEEDKSACDSAIKNGITVVNAEFVLTGILRQEIDINSYLLFTETQAMKSLSQEAPNKKRKR